MGWRDNYRTASFRGVSFRVEAHQATFGRRQVTHEYPQRDVPFTEDLGRKGREFSVDAYVLGADYQVQRDRLITASEEAGPGELVHPYLGSRQVVCTGLSVRESKDEGGIAYLSFTFVEAGEAKYPVDSVDGVSGVSAAAQELLDSAGNAFASSWSVAGMPSFVVDAAARQIASLAGFFSRVLGSPRGAVQDVADFARRVQRLVDRAMSLADEPLDLAAEVIALVTGVRSLFGAEAGPVLRDLHAAYPVGRSVGGGTAARQQEAANAEAFASLVRVAAVAERTHQAVVNAASGAFATHEDAVTERELIAIAIDDEMTTPQLADSVYLALSSLNAEAVRGVPSPGQQLPQLVEYIPPATVPTLVLAHRLYDDATRAVQIATRNRIVHPGFVSGGVPLRVISDV